MHTESEVMSSRYLEYFDEQYVDLLQTVNNTVTAENMLIVGSGAVAAYCLGNNLPLLRARKGRLIHDVDLVLLGDNPYSALYKMNEALVANGGFETFLQEQPPYLNVYNLQAYKAEIPSTAQTLNVFTTWAEKPGAPKDFSDQLKDLPTVNLRDLEFSYLPIHIQAAVTIAEILSNMDEWGGIKGLHLVNLQAYQELAELGYLDLALAAKNVLPLIAEPFFYYSNFLEQAEGQQAFRKWQDTLWSEGLERSADANKNVLYVLKAVSLTIGGKTPKETLIRALTLKQNLQSGKIMDLLQNLSAYNANR
jgi:hypothetical protein